MAVISLSTTWLMKSSMMRCCTVSYPVPVSYTHLVVVTGGNHDIDHIASSYGFSIIHNECSDLGPVSYTHLDVYKRQVYGLLDI